MGRVYLGLLAAALTITACDQQTDAAYETGKARIDAECAAKNKTQYKRIKCENEGRMTLRTQLGYDTSSDYRQFLLERLKIAAALDAKKISAQDAEVLTEQAWLDYQRMADLAYEIDRQRRQNSMDSVMNGLQSYGASARSGWQPASRARDNVNCDTVCDSFGCHTECY